MKIFATSDIHANKQIMDKLNQIEADLILICGDIGAKGGRGRTFKEFSAYQKESADYLCSVLDNIQPIKAKFILGNDDWFEYESPYYLQHQTVIDGLYFIPFEYVLLTPFNTNREVNENKLEYELMKLDANSNSIIVAHTPPWDAGDILYNGSHCGSLRVREWIENTQPKIYLCGHIHEDNSVHQIGNTLIFNCACIFQTNELKGWLIDTDTLEYSSLTI
ncbi:MAG: metallophosphoesterase [Parabacteroides sp.]|nr:metallophosphoesterase [Parabacteroides sp.]